MVQRFFLLACALSWSLTASATADPGRVHELARSPRWLRLLHYKSRWLRAPKSTVDGAGFFFSPEGARDPEKEMLATVAAFESQSSAPVSKIPQPVACAYPARFRFLNEELHLGLPQPRCERFAEFFGRFHGAESVTLVFSTAFPNNPASMFGHTFLRINAKPLPGQPKQDLLDYGLNYAAQVPDDENNFLFVWFGLTGGYVGTFSSLPYYAKVQEYNSSESRDLWEYNLNFTPEETWWVLANVWELEVNASSSYYFFDKNCSFEILTLLEVAKPDWELSDYFFQVIPGETVKKIARIPGAVRSVGFRPSLFRKLLALGGRLSAAERRSFFFLLEGEGFDTATVPTLDTAARYFFYLKQQKNGKLNETENALFVKTLAARARTRSPSPPEPIFDQSSRPDWGHHAARLSLGTGLQPGSGGYGWFQEIEAKSAYHDLLNHDTGFVPFSEISFPRVVFRYSPSERRFWLQKAELLAIQSLSPASWLKSGFSWKVRLSYEVPPDLCAFCHVLHAEGGVGLSHPIAGDRLRAYELLGLFGELGSPLRQSWRAGPRLTAGLAANATAQWKHQLELSANHDPWRHEPHATYFSAFWGQSYFLSQEWEVRLWGKVNFASAAGATSRSELLSQILYYF